MPFLASEVFIFSQRPKRCSRPIAATSILPDEPNEISLINKIGLIEKKIGRTRRKKNDPRVCDIDIIDFDGLIKKNKTLELPHPRCHERNFVLYPIRQIDPKWTHPILRKNVDFLIKDLNQNSRIEITRLRKSVIIKQ